MKITLLLLVALLGAACSSTKKTPPRTVAPPRIVMATDSSAVRELAARSLARVEEKSAATVTRAAAVRKKATASVLVANRSGDTKRIEEAEALAQDVVALEAEAQHAAILIASYKGEAAAVSAALEKTNAERNAAFADYETARATADTIRSEALAAEAVLKVRAEEKELLADKWRKRFWYVTAGVSVAGLAFVFFKLKRFPF